MSSRPQATRAPLVFNVSIAAPEEAVFQAFCGEPQRWLCRTGSFEPVQDGQVQLCWPDGCAAGRVLQWAPPTTVRFSWRMEGDPLPETMVVFSTTRGQRGDVPCTLVEVEHYGFGAGPEWEPLYVGFARGWSGYLKNLRAYLEAGIDLREPEE